MLLVYETGPTSNTRTCRLCGTTAFRALVKSGHGWICRFPNACEKRRKRAAPGRAGR